MFWDWGEVLGLGNLLGIGFFWRAVGMFWGWVGCFRVGGALGLGGVLGSGGDLGLGGMFQDWCSVLGQGVFWGQGCPRLLEGIIPSLPQYLQMKWPLLDVPAGATLKDNRSPSPAHLVRAAPTCGVVRSQRPHDPAVGECGGGLGWKGP